MDTRTDPSQEDDLVLATRIGRACYQLYVSQPTGLAPDVVAFMAPTGAQLEHALRKRSPVSNADGQVVGAAGVQQQEQGSLDSTGVTAGSAVEVRAAPPSPLEGVVIHAAVR